MKCIFMWFAEATTPQIILTAIITKARYRQRSVFQGYNVNFPFTEPFIADLDLMPEYQC